MKIQIVDYNPEWKNVFKQEAKAIKRALGKDCFALCHIGGTAVKGLSARPIVDIMLVVHDFAALAAKKDALIKLGYERVGQGEIPTVRTFEKQGDILCKIVAFEKSDRGEIERRVALRNYLRSHTDVAAQVSKKKIELAETSLDFRDYLGNREAFFRALEETALLWQITQDRLMNCLMAGMLLGVGSGVLFGTILFDLALGMGIGMCMGAVFGILFYLSWNDGKKK